MWSERESLEINICIFVIFVFDKYSSLNFRGRDGFCVCVFVFGFLIFYFEIIIDLREFVKERIGKF